MAARPKRNLAPPRSRVVVVYVEETRGAQRNLRAVHSKKVSLQLVKYIQQQRFHARAAAAKTRSPRNSYDTSVFRGVQRHMIAGRTRSRRSAHDDGTVLILYPTLKPAKEPRRDVFYRLRERERDLQNMKERAIRYDKEPLCASLVPTRTTTRQQRAARMKRRSLSL